MKRLIKSSFCIILVMIASSCEIGDGEMGKTRLGKQIFDGWGIDMYCLFGNVIDPALHFNQYLEAPEPGREEVLNQYFQNLTFTEIDDRHWMFSQEQSNAKIYFEMVSGNNLNEEGAIMRIYNIGSQIPETVRGVVFFLENVGDSQWRLLNNNNFDMTFHFLNETLPSGLKDADFTLSGSGFFKHQDYASTILDFEILSDMAVSYSNNHLYSSWSWGSSVPVVWERGTVTLTAKDPSTGDSNTVKATIMENLKVNITIGGITQEWSQFNMFF
ncbi:MAG: hypothetical protein J6T86_06330 [Bacteroidales bacterium]|nr:hypothetical protein [Bacteroidales bacterium]